MERCIFCNSEDITISNNSDNEYKSLVHCDNCWQSFYKGDIKQYNRIQNTPSIWYEIQIITCSGEWSRVLYCCKTYHEIWRFRNKLVRQDIFPSELKISLKGIIDGSIVIFGKVNPNKYESFNEEKMKC